MKALVLLLLAQVAAPDVELDAMKAEVKRALTLSMPAQAGQKANQKPYYASAFLTDRTVSEVSASFGALVRRAGNKSIDLSTRLRVGSPTFDNSNFGGGGDRRFSPLAEFDADVARHGLWLRFDEAYKGALEDYARKEAFVETNRVTEKVDDFSKSKPVVFLQPKATLTVDADGLAASARVASKAFVGIKELQEGTVSYEHTAESQSHVTSEGAVSRFGWNKASVTLMASAIASDGAEVRGTRRFTGASSAELPSAAALSAEAQALGARVAAISRLKPADEDYAGPVLFTGQAAALFFAQTIAEPLARPRLPLGTNTSGRLVERLGKHVASKLVSVFDDPTLRSVTVDGKPVSLWGHFPIDDDGVPSQRVSLIEAGVLKTYFMSRVPTAKVKESNGHCRGDQGAAGNMFVEASEKTPLVALKKRLADLAKEEDSDFGLLVAQAEEYVPRSWGNEGQRLSSPLVMYKVFADGREELVRGLVFKPASQRVLKDIVAMGDDTTVLNLELRGQSTSLIAPSVLVRLMELSRTKDENEKPPALPRP